MAYKASVNETIFLPVEDIFGVLGLWRGRGEGGWEGAWGEGWFPESAVMDAPQMSVKWDGWKRNL